MIQRPRATGKRADITNEATVVTSCPDCGVIRVGARAVTVLVDAAPEGTIQATFACPTCERRTTQRIGREVLGGLRAIGVSFRLLTRPAEADEVHDGPPITAEDVEAFSAAMDDPAWRPSLS